VRRAERQIRALFGRTAVEVFPPPGPDRRDSFFARPSAADEKNPRLYLGVAARAAPEGRAAAHLPRADGRRPEGVEGGRRHKNPDNPADPYMTLLGYFNSCASSAAAGASSRTRSLAPAGLRLAARVGETEGPFANRRRSPSPQELTSRESTSEVAETKRRLALPASTRRSTSTWRSPPT
jgi:hypothetical protein